MTLEEARQTLVDESRNLKRYPDVAKINEAFLVFWESAPSKDDFCKTMHGVPLTTVILYEMCKR